VLALVARETLARRDCVLVDFAPDAFSGAFPGRAGGAIIRA
jgi:hypothetical protein